MAQEQVHKQKSRGAEEAPAEQAHADVSNKELAERTDELVASIDDVLEDQVDDELLAEIDDVLEEDAEEFVAGFVQAGGE